MRLKGRIATVVLGTAIAAGGLVAGTAQADVEIHSSNTCQDCEAKSGNATGVNNQSAQVGQSSVIGNNAQDGDNKLNAKQSSNNKSGSASTGTTIGVVAGKDSNVKIVTANDCTDCSASTGDAIGVNNLAAFVGLSSIIGNNAQNGDNKATIEQVIFSSTGDAVTGTVVGVVTA